MTINFLLNNMLFNFAKGEMWYNSTIFSLSLLFGVANLVQFLINLI